MKTKLTYTLLAAAAACGFAQAQTTAYTTPVGYVSLGDTTVGQPAVKANTDATIAVPLARATEFAGETLSVGVGSLTVKGTPAWTANQFTSVPYCLTVKSGAQNGLMALITANTADTLSLSVVVGNLAAVAPDDKIVIAKCWTISSLLPIAGIPNGTQLFAFDGVAPGINISASQIYAKSPTSWVQIAGGSGNADNVILYPGESFILRTAATAVTSLVVSGEVPTFNHRTIVSKLAAGAQDNRVSYFGPVGEAMSAASIPASNGDQLLIFNNGTAGRNKGASIILAKAPAGWVGIAGVSGNQDAFQIGSGVGYILRRAASNPIGNVEWNDQQTYIPSL